MKLNKVSDVSTDEKKVSIKKITKKIVSVNLSMKFSCYSLSMLAGLRSGDLLKCNEEAMINLETKELGTTKQFVFKNLDEQGNIQAELE